jgi:hypothetical protein
MPSLLSGSIARSGGSNTYITLPNAQPQLPATDTTETGFTLVTDSTLVTSYRSSLGFLLFTTGTISNQIPGQNIVLAATGTATVVVSGSVFAVGTDQGQDFISGAALRVVGGISTQNRLVSDGDIWANTVQIGRGSGGGSNNIAITGVAAPSTDPYPTGHENIVIGDSALINMNQSVKSIAIGRLALSSGTNIINSIAIGDSALQLVGVRGDQYVGTVTGAIYNGYFWVPIGSYAVVTAQVNAGSNIINVTSVTTGTVSVGSAFFTTDGIRTVIDGKTITALGTGTGGIGTYVMSSISSTTATVATSMAYYNVNLYTTSTQYPSYTTGQGIITVPNHGLSSGQSVTIAYFKEPDTTEYDPSSYTFDQIYYAKTIDNNTLALYSDSALLNPSLLDDDVAWMTDAPVYIPNTSEKNIAIGTNAGSKLTSGKQNFFIGDNAAPNFVNGSYNFFIGPSVAQNMTYGNNIIAIGSDNLVDGLDDQINIGSVFYYNGDGYLQLNGDVGLGLGYIATSTEDAALAVLGGVGISENIIVGSVVDSTATTNGAMVVAGGAGIGGTVFIGGGLDVSKGNKNVNLSPIGGNVIITPTLGGGLTIYPNASGTMDNVNIGTNTPANGIFTNVRVTVTATSTSTNTGALQVVGGVGIAGNMFIRGGITGVITTATNIAGGARGSLPYQTTSGSTTLLPIGNTTTILVSNGLVPYWADVNSLLSNTATVASKAFVYNAAAATYYVTLNDSVNTFSNFDSTIELTYNNVTHQLSVGSATSATSTTTGALHVTGGVGIEGSAYSREGGEYENYLLYVPRVIVSTSTPYTARIGDFWVEPNSGVEFQYIQDGSNRVWIQFAGL